MCYGFMNFLGGTHTARGALSRAPARAAEPPTRVSGGVKHVQSSVRLSRRYSSEAYQRREQASKRRRQEEDGRCSQGAFV